MECAKTKPQALLWVKIRYCRFSAEVRENVIDECCAHFTLDEVKIDLSDREVRTLLDMLTLAERVADWEENEEISVELHSYLRLKEKIFSQVKSHGYDDLVEYDETTQQYHLTLPFDTICHYADFFNDFREDTFWQEFVDHMVDRDLIKRLGEEKFNQLTLEEREILAEGLEKRYWPELEKHGLDHFHIIHPQSG